MMLNKRTTATLIAALRNHQITLAACPTPECLPPELLEISSGKGTLEPLSWGEIDDLCAELDTPVLDIDVHLASEALGAFCSTINNTGGAVLRGDDVVPAEDQEWTDLGEAYRMACLAFGQEPLFADDKVEQRVILSTSAIYRRQRGEVGEQLAAARRSLLKRR